MGKRGFTLVELLAVISLLGVILAIAVPSFRSINNLIKNNMLKTKLDFIKEVSILYGEDKEEILKNSNKLYNSYQCLSIKVNDLVPEYINSDNDCKKEDYDCINDPSENNKYLDSLEIIIYYKNKKVEAIINQDNNLVCS